MTKIRTAYTSLKDGLYYVIVLCNGAWYVFKGAFRKAKTAARLERQVLERGSIDASKWIDGKALTNET